MGIKSLWVFCFVALLLGSCAVKPKAVTTSTRVTVQEEEVPLPAPDPPIVIADRDLRRGHDLARAKYLANETDDANLRNWLQLRLLSIDLAEKRAEELRHKEDRTYTEDRELAQVLAALEKEYYDVGEAIDRRYKQYRIRFVKSDEVDLEGPPLEDLLAIKQEIFDSCRRGSEIHVLGWGCALGKEEVTQRVSEDRAKNVAIWLGSQETCKEGMISRGGFGVYSTDVPGVDKAVLEELRSKHRIAEVLIARDSELPPLPADQRQQLPAGTWTDGERTYVNSALGFRISLPRDGEGWFLVPEPDDFPDVSVVLAGRGAQIQVLVHQLSSDPRDSLEALGARFRDLKKDRVKGYKEVKASLVKHQSGDYYELQYYSLIGSGQMRFCERLFLNRREMITVIAMAAPERWRLEEQSIIQALNSMALD